MNEEINLKPIDTGKKELSSAEEAKKELLDALGMSENAKPEAINTAVKKINELHSKYFGLQTGERFEANKEAKKNEILAVLNKLKSAPSIDIAKEIIKKEYNNSRAESNIAHSGGVIKIETIGEFSIDGQDYELLYDSGAQDKLLISKSGSFIPL